MNKLKQIKEWAENELNYLYKSADPTDIVKYQRKLGSINALNELLEQLKTNSRRK